MGKVVLVTGGSRGIGAAVSRLARAQRLCGWRQLQQGRGRRGAGGGRYRGRGRAGDRSPGIRGGPCASGRNVRPRDRGAGSGHRTGQQCRYRRRQIDGWSAGGGCAASGLRDQCFWHVLLRAGGDPADVFERRRARRGDRQHFCPSRPCLARAGSGFTTPRPRVRSTLSRWAWGGSSGARAFA